MGFRQVYLHFIWATWKRNALSASICEFVETRVPEIATGVGVRVIALRAVGDHIHVLTEWNTTSAISDVVREWKSRTAVEWNSAQDELLRWQAGYGVVSVSQKEVKKVAGYVYRQDEHHRLGTTIEEYEAIDIS